MSSYKTSKEEIEHENSLKSSLPELHKTTGWRVTTSTHSRSQALVRHPHKTTEDWQALHRNIVHGLIKSKIKNDGTHLIHSTSHNHAIVAAVNHKKKEVHVITVLESGKSKAMSPDDHKIIVEYSNILTFKEFIGE